MRYVKRGMSGKCGVYLITNTANGKRYVGASYNMANRVNQHFGKICLEKYADINPFYGDIRKYGRDAFDIKVLEFCSREQKLETERKWYYLLKPEYNLVEPDDCPLRHKAVQEKSKRACASPKGVANRLRAHRTESCRAKCRDIQKKRMVPCRAIRSDGTTFDFESYCEAGRWLGRDDVLASTVSHIKRAIETNTLAFGYRWEVIRHENPA